MMDTTQRTIASRRNEIAPTSKTHRAEGIEICPICRGRAKASEPSFREMVLDGTCASVLVVILVTVCYLSEQWLERASHCALDRLIWSERIESWNR